MNTGTVEHGGDDGCGGAARNKRALAFACARLQS